MYSLGVRNILERVMHYQDYYKIPTISHDATAEEIKKSFRKLARKYHPDVFHEKDAESRMKEINEAFAVLTDPEKRAAYMATLARPPELIGQGGCADVFCNWRQSKFNEVNNLRWQNESFNPSLTLTIKQLLKSCN